MKGREYSGNQGSADVTRRYLKELDLSVDHSQFDPEDKQMAMQERRQGLGLSRSQPIIDIGSVCPFG
jgi:hypothetical protein